MSRLVILTICEIKGSFVSTKNSGNEERISMKRNDDSREWNKREARFQLVTPLKPECSIERSAVEENWVGNGYMLSNDEVIANYPLRFTSRNEKRLDRAIQPGTRLILERFRFSRRKGRKETEIEVRKYRIVGPEWTWFVGLTKEERILEFLRGGCDLKDAFSDDYDLELNMV